MAGLVISRESWDRIPAEYKPAMIAAVERMRVRLNASLDESDRQYVAKMSAEGVKMVRPRAPS
jgi:TRAP-type C4-dicarboxylate transport system substrate-binding protein